MKFKFSKNLDFQNEAISSVVDLFDTGENTFGESKEFVLRSPESELSPVVKNDLEIDDARLLKNLQSIQKKNDIEEKTESLDEFDFSVEMETGTGKTYVYLRTILELHQKYGLSKFIILVPSVAIREGVLKTLSQTREHFREMYNAPYQYFPYDSKKLSQVREFAQSLDVEIMVTTIQSFNKAENVMRQTPDRFHGDSPLEMVASTRPVVVMDEPQNMESELSKSAIADLSPLFKLRYSATHKDKRNLVYKLSPVEAYKQGLVKRIEVYGVEEQNPGAFHFKVKDIRAERGKSPKAKVIVEVKATDGEYKSKEITVKSGDDLKRKTKNEKYEGLIVNEIDAGVGSVELSDGEMYRLEDRSGENKVEIFRTQIRETIKAHMKKQTELGSDVKVLSLFFIDRVANYTGEEPLIKQLFEEEFQKQQKNYELFKDLEAGKVHNGYFANETKKGETIYKDTTGKTNADKEAYDLIMKNKEQLLSFNEPTSFVFSHSALKEGWDNPNIFQICTLNETHSEMKKRQEIGRGLRLALDKNGERVFDQKVNRLTVVANESYEEFAGALQKEYQDAGYLDAPKVPDARKRVTAKFKKRLNEENTDFQKLWEQIRKKTKYNISVDTSELVENAVGEINELDLENLVVRVDKVSVDFDDTGKVKTIYENSAAGEKISSDVSVGNVVERLVKETGVTKRTVFEILSKVANLGLLFENPEEYQRSVSVKIKNALNDLLINKGLEYLPTEDVWEIDVFEDLKAYEDNSIKSEKSAYDHVVYDSKGEREFAENLESSSSVSLFAKLPPKFVIDTPLGAYNPDWAIVKDTEEGKKLYLVRETKFMESLDELRPGEKQKILCGEKHFSAIGVDFATSTKENLSDLENGEKLFGG